MADSREKPADFQFSLQGGESLEITTNATGFSTVRSRNSCSGRLLSSPGSSGLWTVSSLTDKQVGIGMSLPPVLPGCTLPGIIGIR